MNKYFLFLKKIYQITLYLFETLGIALLLTLITNKHIPANNLFESIERITVYYALYQIIIFSILQQLNDIKKDENLAILSFYKKLNIYCSNPSKDLKNILISIIDKQLDRGTFNDLNIRKEYNDILEVLSNNKKIDKTIVEWKIVEYEHNFELVNLNWKYSILLRILK